MINIIHTISTQSVTRRSISSSLVRFCVGLHSPLVNIVLKSSPQWFQQFPVYFFLCDIELLTVRVIFESVNRVYHTECSRTSVSTTDISTFAVAKHCVRTVTRVISFEFNIHAMVTYEQQTLRGLQSREDVGLWPCI